MSKPRKTLHLKLPCLQPKDTWRHRVLAAVRDARTSHGVVYDAGDRIALDVKVYDVGKPLERRDVDNVLKSLMDALQAQLGGQGKKIINPKDPIVSNDCHIWRVSIEKVRRPPKLSSTAGGHLTITRMK